MKVSKGILILWFIFFAIKLSAQQKATLIAKKDFTIPSLKKYSFVIKSPDDTAYCYYSIFLRSYNSKISGVYIEIDNNKIKFESFVSNGKLNGLFRQYNNSGNLWRYGKYINNTLIEDNEIIYNVNNIVEIKQTFPNSVVRPK